MSEPTNWREWLLFVFTDNSPETQALSDEELKALVCRVTDARDLSSETYTFQWLEERGLKDPFDRISIANQLLTQRMEIERLRDRLTNLPSLPELQRRYGMKVGYADPQ